jgi:hypothetical protein
MKCSSVVTTAFFMTALLFSVSANADCARIAYSRTTGSYGTGYETGSCSSASSDKAVDACWKSDCIVELTVQGQCGSIARQVDNTQYISTGVAASKSGAGNKAMAACGSNCKLVTSICAD